MNKEKSGDDMTVFSFQCLKAENYWSKQTKTRRAHGKQARERGWERLEGHDERSNEVRSDEEEERSAGWGCSWTWSMYTGAQR